MAENLQTTATPKALTPYERVARQLDAALPAIAKALPKHLTAERLGRMALNSIRKNPKLAECDPLSVLSAVAELAAVGLEIGGPLGQCWLIPYARECTPQLGYKGVLALAWRSNSIAGISVEDVREGDVFDYRKGDDERITHIPNLQDAERESRPTTYFYAIITMRAGGKVRSVMSNAQILKHAERYSKAYQKKKADSPWLDPLGRVWMAKKTVLLQALKVVELSPEDRRLIDSTEAELFNDEVVSSAERISMLQELSARPEPGTLPPPMVAIDRVDGDDVTPAAAAKAASPAPSNNAAMAKYAHEITAAIAPPQLDAIINRASQDNSVSTGDIATLTELCEKHLEFLASLDESK